LVLQRARLNAEVSRTPLEFPSEEAKRQPQLVSAETRSHQAREASLQSSLDVIKDQIEQRRLEIIELETKQRAVSNNLRLVRERLDMSSDLLKSGLMAKMEHVQLQGQVEDFEGQLASVKASIPRAQAAMTEAKQRMDEERSKFLRQAEADLATAELDIARNQQLLSQASDQQIRAQITSPTDGTVKNLHANTIGGVVKGGDAIMEIVPLHEKLQVEAKLNPADRGYVQTGQKATVKISAYDYTTYGGLEGIVTLVAPDTTTIADKPPFYRVLVETEKRWLGDEVEKRSITSGMQATVEIYTGSRSVMHYLLKPVLKLRHEAFHER
jgi:adhesin transport system membrane fusion protein